MYVLDLSGNSVILLSSFLPSFFNVIVDMERRILISIIFLTTFFIFHFFVKISQNCSRYLDIDLFEIYAEIFNIKASNVLIHSAHSLNLNFFMYILYILNLNCLALLVR